MNSGSRQPTRPVRRRADATPGATHLRYHYPDDGAAAQAAPQAAPSQEIASYPTAPHQEAAHPASASAPAPRRSATAGEHVIPEPNAANSVLRTEGLFKSYRKGRNQVEVLKGVQMNVPHSKLTVILGQSGSGKSTLLHMLGTLDAPDRGEIYFHDVRIDNLPSARKEHLRNERFGMIFQFYHLLPELTTLENVLVPRMIGDGIIQYWLRRKKYVERAKHLLNLVGLSHRLRHKPNQLSGGEMQRTAIARALLASPELLLADEPTGNLDEKTGQGILEILRTLNDEQNLTIVMVTHDISIARQAHHVVTLTNGQVEPRQIRATPPVESAMY